MAPEEFNLKLGSKDRPEHFFRSLDDVEISKKKIGLTYHHIVPYSKLRDFWNKLVESRDIEKLEFLPHLRGGISGGSYVDVLSPVGKLGGADALQAAGLASKIYSGAIRHGSEAKLRPTGWDNLMGVYAWIPGNLFVGPQNRFDDPGDKLDEAASSVIGSVRGKRYDKLSEAYTQILRYLGGGPGRKFALPASNALREVVTRVGIQRYDDKDWTWIEGRKGPQIQR
ncbi:hypothetical protein [Parafrankia sp. FMc2]|uniref:hypothetical protein n=1 Tax=Parafrankia sp. FMc2 TaxID=3233196 RepID=UPI0034D744E4